MEPREIQNDEEVTVDLAHLAVSLMKKWRMLLLSVVVGLVLGCVWQLRPQDPSALLDEDDTQALLSNVQLTAMLQNQFEQKKAYAENSVLMGLDGNHVYTAEIGYVTVEKVPGMAEACLNGTLRSEEVRKSLGEVLNVTKEAELDQLTYSRAYGQDSLGLTFNDSSMELSGGGAHCYMLGVFAPSQEQAEQALEVIREAVAQAGKSLPATVSLTENYSNISFGRSDAVLNMQAQVTRDLMDNYKQVADREAKFQDEEKKLYASYLATGVIPTELLEESSSSFLKTPVILAVVMAVLACVWYVAAYFLTSGVKTVDEVEGATGRNVLGFVDETALPKCRFDRWLTRLENGRYPAAVPVEYITATVDKLGNAIVVYDEKNESLKQLAEKLSVPTNALLSESVESLKNIDKGTQVVLLVKLGATGKMQLSRESAICRQYGISLVGTILVK